MVCKGGFVCATLSGFLRKVCGSCVKLEVRLIDTCVDGVAEASCREGYRWRTRATIGVAVQGHVDVISYDDSAQ